MINYFFLMFTKSYFNSMYNENIKGNPQHPPNSWLRRSSVKFSNQNLNRKDTKVLEMSK